MLKGFTIKLGKFATEISKIVKENAFNVESFNILPGIQDAIEKQNKEQNRMIQAISNPLKDIKIPPIVDMLQEKK